MPTEDSDGVRSAMIAMYPQCGEVLESNYSALLSSEYRQIFYVHRGNLSFVFENPIYRPMAKQQKIAGNNGKMANGNKQSMSTKDFLSAIPSFSAFTDEQLSSLEERAIEQTFKKGDIIFRQGEKGENFYVISHGTVDIMIADDKRGSNSARSKPGKPYSGRLNGSYDDLIDADFEIDLGKVVNRLNEGSYFGERALLTMEPRAASIKVTSDELVCLVFPRSVFEDIISGSDALIGNDKEVNVDWSKDHETRSLFKHIENIMDIVKATNASVSPKMKRILYELTTAFTPELSPDEVISRMVMTVKAALKVDRVGLFVLSDDKRSIILKVSERGKGVRLPVRGIAGCVLQTNSAIMINDAYQDARFDATMDRRTGYRTRQILGVPLRHPLTREPIGLLQVTNRMETTNEEPEPRGNRRQSVSMSNHQTMKPSLESFTIDHQKVLELACEQLSELLHGRTDVFIQAGVRSAKPPPPPPSVSAKPPPPMPRNNNIANSAPPPPEKPVINTGRNLGQGVGDGLVLLNSADITEKFQLELHCFSLGEQCMSIIEEGKFAHIEVEVSLYLALNLLCEPKTVSVDMQTFLQSKAQKHDNQKHPVEKGLTFKLDINDSVEFDICVKDLPRASRLMFKVLGHKKGSFFSSKSKSRPPSSASIGSDGGSRPVSRKVPAGPNEVTVGWVASILFDYKGGLNSILEGLELFPGDIDVPINTTLNNNLDSTNICDKYRLSAVLCPDLVLSSDAITPRVKLVHSMPLRQDLNLSPASTSSTSTNSTPTAGSESSPTLTPTTSDVGINDGNDDSLTEADNSRLEHILKVSFNPLSSSVLLGEDRTWLWSKRYSLLNRAELLPAFVMSVQWECAEKVQEFYDLIDLWAVPTPVQSLQLLDRRFMDSKTRAFAAHCLEELSDDELALYMLQLVQQLKFENYVDSALSRFLLRRALTNQKLIGHIYFWLLQSEVYNKDVSRRFVILLQVYLLHCGSHRIELGHQMFVMKKLELVAQAVAVGDSKEARKKILKDRLSEIVLPSVFKLPLNPHMEICGIDISRCRVMESKKKPLWLTLTKVEEGGQHGEGKDLVLMLKVGDDLRQDALIMQLLRVMDDLWKKEGMDMQMRLYDCISTGHERGLLQVVLQAKTIGSILLDATDAKKANKRSGTLSRKFGSAFKALNDYSVLKEWICSQVKHDLRGDADEAYDDGMAKDVEEELEKRVSNFMISTAAYCVASYVLGLGDRHNDNLMITTSGHFFHIDFGHILGNFKWKLGVKRERAPFVFTPAMKAVMAGDGQYELFVDLCCDAYNILRDNSVLLVSLFSLAIPCNLSELRREEDVEWIYEKLMVGASEEEASAHFKSQLLVSLNTRGTRLNDAAHMLAHA